MSDQQPLVRQEHKGLVLGRLIFGMLVAAAVAIIITVFIQRDNQVAACLRGSQRSIIDARFFEQAATARAAAGKMSTDQAVATARDLYLGKTPEFQATNLDQKTAIGYMLGSMRMRETIPMPNGWEGLPETRGNVSTDRHEGCMDAYPAPLPFVE